MSAAQLVTDLSMKLNHMFLVCEFEKPGKAPLYLRMDMEQEGVEIDLLPTSDAAKHDEKFGTNLVSQTTNTKHVTLADLLRAAESHAKPELFYNLFTRNCQHFVRDIYELATGRVVKIPMDDVIPV